MPEKTDLFLHIAIDSPLYRCFDYLPPEGVDISQLKPGMRVHVPFGQRELVGVLVDVVTTTDVPASKLKAAIKVLDSEPIFPEDILALLNWAAKYYHYPLGQVLASALPKLLRSVTGNNSLVKLQQKIAKEQEQEVGLFAQEINPAKPDFILNDYQKLAIGSIINCLECRRDNPRVVRAEVYNNASKVFLLDGVTGSGKTEVYLQAIAKVLGEQKQALVLVPEIGLTPQTIARFKARFNVPIAVFHSRLTDRERLYHWLLATLGIAKIIIGTRSAIFTPLRNPGIIVVDEEHDLSFHQQSGFRYATRDLAVKRGELADIPVIFGSATPSLTSLKHAFEHSYQHLLLPERAGDAIHPIFNLIDLKAARLKGGFAVSLVAAMAKHLAAGNQVLVFLNRRGYAPATMCHTCGWMAECSNCDVRLTLHQNPAFLSCHHCGRETSVPQICPKCGSNNLLALGLGTERAEVMLKKLFPEVNMHRIDRDTTKHKGSLESMFADVTSGACQILLGTQMLTKGHHFPNVTLVAILNADGGLFSADFQAVEYLAQLIIQVSGRAGRSDKPSEVYIQTHHPEHPLLQELVHYGYSGFAKKAMLERQTANLPPFTNLALLRAESYDAESGLRFLQLIRKECINFAENNITVLGPIKATIARQAGKYRTQLWLQSGKRADLDQVLNRVVEFIAGNPKLVYAVKWYLDVDPVEI